MVGPELEDAVRQLVQRVSLAMLAQPAVVALIQDAVTRGTDERFGSDPSIAEALGEAARENALHWLRSMSVDPAARVEPAMSSRVIGIAREGSRWGVTGTLRQAYRAGEQATMSSFTTSAFALSTDRVLLPKVLDHVSRSLAHFVDATVDALLAVLEQERGSLSGDRQIRQLEVVNRILGGTPPSPDEIRRALDYPLGATHVCVMVSAPPRLADRASLVDVATTVCRLTDSTHRLLVHASTSSLWLWISPRRWPTHEDLDQATSRHPEVRLAVGPVGAGQDGFRRTHEGAFAARRLVQDAVRHRIVHHHDVAAVLLLAADPASLREFVHATLGGLALAPEDLRETMRVFMHHRYNASLTARLLFTHRNTVLQRVRRAEQQLPQGTVHNGTHVCLALDAMYWLDLRPA